MEVKPGERLGVAVEELRRLAAHDAVEGRHPLLAVEQQLHHARRELAIAAMGGGLRLRGPDEQAADGVALVERIHQPAHLVAIPDVAPLELGQGHVAAVDVVEDGGDLHLRRIFPVRSCCIIPCLRERGCLDSSC